MLALSRIFLDNVANVQASWVTQGPKIAQVSLFFRGQRLRLDHDRGERGAAAGVHFRLSEAQIRHPVTDAGFQPRQRLMDYTLV